jgi:hypothetical protein
MATGMAAGMSAPAAQFTPAAVPAGMQRLMVQTVLPTLGKTGTMALPDGSGNYVGCTFQITELGPPGPAGGIWTCMAALTRNDNHQAIGTAKLTVSGSGWSYIHEGQAAIIAWN